MLQLSKLRKKIFQREPSLPCQQLATHYLSFLETLDVKTSSKQTYTRQLKVFIEWAGPQTRFTKETMLDFKESLVEKKLSPYTINSYFIILKKFFNWLDVHKLYPDVAREIKLTKRKQGFKKDALSVDQAKKLLFSIDRSGLAGKRDYALINIMLRTGLRTIEIIKAAKVDMTSHSGEIVLWIQGKGHDSKDEFVLLTEASLLPLREYLYARGNVKESDPLFASHSTKNFGDHLTTRSISRIVKERLKEIGIIDSRFTAHSLRHTAITFSLLAGATPQEARVMARHADINTTLIYAHNIHRIQQAPERKIDKLLGN